MPFYSHKFVCGREMNVVNTLFCSMCTVFCQNFLLLGHYLVHWARLTISYVYHFTYIVNCYLPVINNTMWTQLTFQIHWLHVATKMVTNVKIDKVLNWLIGWHSNFKSCYWFRNFIPFLQLKLIFAVFQMMDAQLQYAGSFSLCASCLYHHYAQRACSSCSKCICTNKSQ